MLEMWSSHVGDQAPWKNSGSGLSGLHTWLTCNVCVCLSLSRSSVSLSLSFSFSFSFSISLSVPSRFQWPVASGTEFELELISFHQSQSATLSLTALITQWRSDFQILRGWSHSSWDLQWLKISSVVARWQRFWNAHANAMQFTFAPATKHFDWYGSQSPTTCSFFDRMRSINKIHQCLQMPLAGVRVFVRVSTAEATAATSPPATAPPAITAATTATDATTATTTDT
jgi:hypothetical protein